MRKARESKAKAEADTVESARSWTEYKAKDKVEISRVNTKARERPREKAKARVREKTNDVQKSVTEASDMIRARVESERASM